jgi:hypothetical protein
MIDKESQNFNSRSYAEYEKEARKMNQKVMSELEWMREKAEALHKKEEALQKRQESLLAHEENVSKRQIKTIDQILRNQETLERRDSRTQRELTEVFKKGVKDFIGIRNSIEVRKNPAMAASSAVRTTTERLVNFDDLPPVFKDFEKGLAGMTDLFAGKVIDPLISKISGAAKSKWSERQDKKFLLQNDPRFAGKETGAAEVEAFMKERKEAVKELKLLETKQAKLSELGGYDLSIAAEIQNLKDYLSGKFEQAEESGALLESPEPMKRARKSSGKSGGGSGEICSCEPLLQTIDKTLLGVIVGVTKLDNRLAAIQGGLSEIISLDKRQSLIEEERYEEESKKVKENVGLDSKAQIDVPEELKNQFGLGSLISAFTESFSGITKIFGTITSAAAGFASVVGGLPAISTAISTLGTVLKFLTRFNPIILGVSAVLLAKEFVDMIRDLEIFSSEGEMSKTGKALDATSKALGGAGLTPDSEKSRAEMIKEQSDTGWWDIGDSKKNRYKKQYLDEIERGGSFTPEEAAALKEGFGIDVPEDNLKAGVVKAESVPVTTQDEPDSEMTREEYIKNYMEKRKHLAKDGEGRRALRRQAEMSWNGRQQRGSSPQAASSSSASAASATPSGSDSSGPSRSDGATSEVSKMKSNGRKVREAALALGLDPDRVTGRFMADELVELVTDDGRRIDVSGNLSPEAQKKVSDRVKLAQQLGMDDGSNAHLQAVRRDVGGQLEDSGKKLTEASEAREAALSSAPPVVVAPSSSNVVNNTTALGVRPKARHSEQTFDRMTGSRYAADF